MYKGKPDEYYEGLDKRTKEYKEYKEHKSKGLGDDIEKFTEATGIKKAVDWFSSKTGIDCGCDERKEKLNKLFPKHSGEPKCLEKWEYERIQNLPSKLDQAARKDVAYIYSRIFNTKYHEPCTCSPKRWMRMVNALKQVAQTYES